MVLIHEATEEAENASQPPPDGHEADAVSCSWWRQARESNYIVNTSCLSF